MHTRALEPTMKQGYSLIELMAAVSIIGIIVSFGISAYAKGRDLQIGRSVGEEIISFLSENQKKANIGNRDCSGLYQGQNITINSNFTLTASSSCSTSNGAQDTITISNLSNITTGSITFKPLAGGAVVSTDPLNISYTTTSGTTFAIQVSSSGFIEYKCSL